MDFRRFVEGLFLRLRSGTFLKNVLLIASATALSQLIIILASPLLTRLYTPGDFGIFAVFTSILGLPLTVAGLRYDCSIPLPKKESDAINLFFLSLGVITLVTFLFLPALWLLQDRLAGWTNTPTIGEYWWIIPISLGAGGVYQALTYWAMRHQDFKYIAQSKFTQSLAQVATQIAGSFFLGIKALLLGDASGRLFSCAQLALFAGRRIRQYAGAVSAAGIRGVARRYARISGFSSIATLLDNIGQRFPPLLVASVFSSEILGHFAFAQQILLVSSVLISKSVAQVYTSEATRLAHEGLDSLKTFYIRSAQKLFWVSFAPMAIVALGGRWLFLLVFGDSWETAGIFAQILVPMVLASIVVNPLQYTLYILDRQDLQLVWVTAQLVVSCSTILTAGLLHLSPVAAVLFFSLGNTAVYLLHCALTLWAINRMDGGRMTMSPLS